MNLKLNRASVLLLILLAAVVARLLLQSLRDIAPTAISLAPGKPGRPIARSAHAGERTGSTTHSTGHSASRSRPAAPASSAAEVPVLIAPGVAVYSC